MAADRGRLRLILVGFSGLGPQDHQRELYARAFLDHRGYELVGSCRTSSFEQPIDSVPSLAGLPVYDDLDDAVEGLRPDVACICAPLPDRGNLLVRALRAGVHVLADKPATATAREAALVVAAAEAAARMCVPAYHYRLHPELVALRAAIGRGDLGRIVDVQADFLVPRGDPVPQGEIVNFGGYPLDVVRSLLPQPAASVQALAGARFDGRPPDTVAPDGPDVATLLVEHVDGSTSSVVVGRRPTATGMGRVHRYRVDGTRATAFVDLCRPLLDIAGTMDRSSHGDPPPTVRRLVDRLHASIVDSVHPSHAPDDLLHVARVLETAMTSYASNEAVEVLSNHV